MKYLIIIESPSKAKKIKSILEKEYPAHTFTVLATVGHILNLPKTSLGIDLKKYTGKFQALPDKKKIIKNIMAAARTHDIILIATDNDNEGEAIGYDVMNILNMDYETENRMIFNEITSNGIVSAFNNLTHINLDKVNAQRGRRLIDRLVGFKLSSLTKKFFNNKEITAGRVLSVTTKLINEENKKFLDSYATKLGLFLEYKNYILPFSREITEETEILDLLSKYNTEKLNISFIDCKVKKESPPLPFITSSIMSSSPYSAHETSKVLQKLYQGGHITYIRTDSYNISNTFKQEIASHITSHKGSEYLNNDKLGSTLNTKAHECIRPVNMSKVFKSKDQKNITIYNMIHKRTLHYLMTDYESYSYTFKVYTADCIDEDYFILKINNTKHLGFRENGDNNIDEINKLKQLEYIIPDSIYSSYDLSRPKLLSEGSLITRLRKLNIGRPSTYAHIINNMKAKKYIRIKNIPEKKIKKKIYILKNTHIYSEKKYFIIPEQSNKIVPTDRGIKVTNFLEDNFSKIINYEYSSKLEEYLDLIEERKITSEEVIILFYSDFKDKIEEMRKELKTDKAISEYKYEDYDIFKNIRIKNTRYGWKIIVCVFKKDCYLNVNSKILENIDTVTIEDIKEYFPIIQYHENIPIILLDGHDNGKYIKYMGGNIPLPKNIKYKSNSFFENIDLVEYIKK